MDIGTFTEVALDKEALGAAECLALIDGTWYCQSLFISLLPAYT